VLKNNFFSGIVEIRGVDHLMNLKNMLIRTHNERKGDSLAKIFGGPGTFL
jgi:hypothetical protein